MNRNIIALSGLILVLTFLIIALVGPWYTAGYEDSTQENYFLTRKEGRLGYLSLSTGYDELKEESYWSSHLIKVCNNTLFLVLGAINTSIISLICILGIIFDFGRLKTMRFLGIACSFGTFLLTTMAMLYFMTYWNSQIIVEGTTSGSFSYGFWYHAQGGGTEFSMGPGICWYLMIITGFITLVSCLILIKRPKSKNNSENIEGSEDFKLFVGMWSSTYNNEPFYVEFFPDGKFSGFYTTDAEPIQANWALHDDKLIIQNRGEKITNFDYGFLNNNMDLKLINENNGEALVFKNHMPESIKNDLKSNHLQQQSSSSSQFRKLKTVTLALILGFLIIFPSLPFVLGVSENIVQNPEIHVTTNPFLWRIEGENPSYMYGSYHVNDERILTMPDVIMDAINEADIIYTEIKLDEDNYEEYEQYYLLSDDQMLKDVLSRDVLNRLKSNIKNLGYDISSFEQNKIWQLAFWNLYSLVDHDYLFSVTSKPYLDLYIKNLAQIKNKEIAGLETPEEHFTVLDSLSIEEQVQMLEETLDYLESWPYYIDYYDRMTDILIEEYLDGDLEAFRDVDIVNPENDELSSKIDLLMLTDRNHLMAKRINNLVKNNVDTCFFFAVGVAHYYGEEGIIQLLEDEELTISRVEFNECIECNTGYIRIGGRCYYPYTD